MISKILYVGKQIPTWAKNLSDKYEFVKEKDALTAYKSIFKSIPELIIVSATEHYYNGFFMYKILKKKECTAKIPVVFISRNTGLNSQFKDAITITPDMEAKGTEDIINKILKEHKLSKKEKDAITKAIPGQKELNLYKNNILDELLVSSSILEEFKTLIDSMNFENVLVDNIFKIINKYLDYDIAGIFINNTDESSRNVLSLSIPKNNISADLTSDIRDEFFNEIEKYKRVNEIQCNLSIGNVTEKSDITLKDFKFAKIIPYKYDDKLTGGIFFCSLKQPDIYQSVFFKVIEKELDVIFKLKYLFNEQAKHAFIDPMTGLFNRQLFDSNIENEFYRARRYIFNFSLAMLDVDYLSNINKEYGKDFGDYVLTELSSVMKQVFRRTDLIYRYGGEEIIIYLPSTPITKALIPIERLRAKIADHKFEKDGKSAKVTVSIGICANYSKFTEPGQLLDGVADAMMRAKKRGRNKVDIFE